MESDSQQPAKELRTGTWAAWASYGMWGMFPLYWKQIADINAVHTLCHRVFWSAIFLLVVVWLRGQATQLWAIIRHKKSLMTVTACGALIAANWGMYIWAVNSARVAEASLGYYITPLLSIAIGSVFFSEKMDKWTTIALTIAAIGVLSAAVMMGKLPLAALFLAATFSIYSALKKKMGLDALTGLAAETLVVVPIALAWMIGMPLGNGLLGPDIKHATFLIFAGPVTAIPLLTFAYAANRIPLQRIGFIQYFSPTIQLIIGMFIYDEKLGTSMLVAFGTVIIAVVIYLATRKLIIKNP